MFLMIIAEIIILLCLSLLQLGCLDVLLLNGISCEKSIILSVITLDKFITVFSNRKIGRKIFLISVSNSSALIIQYGISNVWKYLSSVCTCFISLIFIPSNHYLLKHLCSDGECAHTTRHLER